MKMFSSFSSFGSGERPTCQRIPRKQSNPLQPARTWKRFKKETICSFYTCARLPFACVPFLSWVKPSGGGLVWKTENKKQTVAAFPLSLHLHGHKILLWIRANSPSCPLGPCWDARVHERRKITRQGLQRPESRELRLSPKELLGPEQVTSAF